MTPEEAAQILASDLTWRNRAFRPDHTEGWRQHLPGLDAALNLINDDDRWSLRRGQLLPPLWTEVGNEAVAQWYVEHPDHPGGNPERSREVNRAAVYVCCWARTFPSAFDSERVLLLQRALFHWNASVRFEIVLAVGCIGDASACEALRELVSLDSEVGWTPTCAQAVISLLSDAKAQ